MVEKCGWVTVAGIGCVPAARASRRAGFKQAFEGSGERPPGSIRSAARGRETVRGCVSKCPDCLENVITSARFFPGPARTLHRHNTEIHMALERTLSIIKPDGVEKGVIGRVISRFETAGLKPVAIRMAHLSQAEAEGFYAVHKARPFFGDLVKFMTGGPVVLMVLEGEDAVAKNREVMGATDPRKAADGTLRKDFATDIEKNTVHGSDSAENARNEIAYFFPQVAIFPYEWKNKR